MIKPEEVVRDEYGFWTHSQFPDFDGREFIPKEEWNRWCAENNINTDIVQFEYDAQEELQDEWYEDGLCDCNKWEPTKPADNAFLLSLHDTDDGPIAIFAIPLEGKAA